MSRYTATLDQPTATINVAAALDAKIEVILSQPATTGATTIAAGSDGAQLPQPTINVVNATSLATSGTVYIVTTQPGGLEEAGPEAVSYTGKTGTTLTGCDGGTGVMATGNAVTGNKLANWVGVDRWFTPDGDPPVLQTAANGLDYLRFRNVGGVVYGSHVNAPGRNGASGAAGPIGLQNRGTYAAATAYVLNDIVTLNGSTYINIQAGTGQTPTTAGTAYWDRVALSGGGAITDPPIIIIDPPPVDNSGSPTVSLDQPGIAARLIQWVSYLLITWTDAQLTYLAQTLKMYGVWLVTPLSYSGTQTDWTSDPTKVKTGSVQEAVIGSQVISRARSKGLGKFYLGLYATPQVPATTEFGPGDWFNDAHWANNVIPTIKNFAGAAKFMGFDGLGIDHENYGGRGSWSWNFSGNTHTEAEVRAKVKQRGAEMMAAILSKFPNVEIISYGARFDGGFGSLVQNVVLGAPLNADSVNRVYINFWDGMTSVSGYARIRFQDKDFYYGAVAITGSPDLRTCMALNVNGELAFLSQRFSNWNYANQRVSISPMSWLGPSGTGDGAYSMNNTPTIAQGTAIVQNARIHGMSGEFANFTQPDPGSMVPPSTTTNGPGGSGNYADWTMSNGRIVNGNFVPVYAAAAPGVVDSTDPTLSGITVTRDNASTVHASGTANDNLGIRAIRWVSGSNSGAATHTFVIDGGGTYQTAYASFAWHAAWTANNIPATVGQTITFVVEDIKGRAVLYTRVAP